MPFESLRKVSLMNANVVRTYMMSLFEGSQVRAPSLALYAFLSEDLRQPSKPADLGSGNET